MKVPCMFCHSIKEPGVFATNLEHGVFVFCSVQCYRDHNAKQAAKVFKNSFKSDYAVYREGM